MDPKTSYWFDWKEQKWKGCVADWTSRSIWKGQTNSYKWASTKSISKGKQHVLQTDACNDQIGATLLQTENDGELYPVMYASRKLLPREPRYAICEEALSVFLAVHKFGVSYTKLIVRHWPFWMVNNTRMSEFCDGRSFCKILTLQYKSLGA